MEWRFRYSSVSFYVNIYVYTPVLHTTNPTGEASVCDDDHVSWGGVTNCSKVACNGVSVLLSNLWVSVVIWNANACLIIGENGD